MYEEFFGFSRRPFSLTPDPEFLYWTDQHRNAFNLICMALLRRAPIALITGEVGAGKTTLLHALLHEISQEYEIGLLSNVVGDSGDLLRWILTAFGHDSEPATRAEALREVEALLTRKWEEGRRSVLIIDEAQNVSDHGIETLRLLTNMDLGKCAPLSLIVSGQPELRQRIAGPSFSAFRQRMGASFHLGPMTLQETQGYVHNRLRIAGGEPEVIGDGAIEAVHRRAQGVPRLTNLLCDLCLAAAFGEDRRRVDADFAESVLAETLALGGLGGLPAEAESDTEAVMHSTAASGSPRALRVAPASVEEPSRGDAGFRNSGGLRRPSVVPSLRLVTDGQADRPVAEEPPLRLTSPVREEPVAAAGHGAAAVLALRHVHHVPGGRQVARRMLGSVAGLAVAASVAAGALVLPAAGTDGAQPHTTEAVASAPAAQETRSAAEPALAGRTAALQPDLAEARLASPDPRRSERLFEQALEEADLNPSAAAIDYSRAAAHGHGRAAYYLAQMYETGDGVAFAPDTAWNWYAAAADDIPAAEQRLGEIAAFATTEDTFATPMFAMAEGGVVELVWQGRGSFVVELAAEPDGETLVHATALTAVRLEVPESIGWWRVRAVGSEPSEWARLDTSPAY